MPPLIIDVEASGFGRGSYPIEVGVVLANGETHCMIIRPEPEWQHWDFDAALLHGITRQLLEQHGHEVVKVAACLNGWLGGQVVYTDAWGNDSSWLALLFDVAEIPQHFKLESLRGLLTEEQLELWHETKDEITLASNFDRHRATNDAVILQRTYCKTAELAPHPSG